MITLGVNIDHVATIRQARKGAEPDPIIAAAICEFAGADCITVHLREDRRHILDRDIQLLTRTVQTRINLEMACVKEMQDIALSLKPYSVCLVPEKREEITTEGGLDVASNFDNLKNFIEKFKSAGILVSLFIDPSISQINAAQKVNADFIEIHTGTYANAKAEKDIYEELTKISKAAILAKELGLRVNAGHGLNYTNVKRILPIEGLEELNIGHSIISRAVFVGLEKAVRDMKSIIDNYNTSITHKGS